MRLISIHLHPFGKFSNKQHVFTDGVHVIKGPNEFGKSTISHAIQHALFTPTKLPEVRMQKTIGDWFPHPSGTSCAVTLEFEHDGVTWTIDKLWSTTPSTVLRSSIGDQFAGALAEEKISEIVGFNRATWQHVFHTSQAALAHTVEQLAADAKDLDDLVATTSASSTHDISPERFTALLDEKIADYYNNWDEQFSRPREGRGLNNRWKQKVGVILKAYYAWQEALAVRTAVDLHNERMDQLQSQKERYEESISRYQPFVTTGKQLSVQLGNRGKLESDLTRLEMQLNQLSRNMEDWGKAKLSLGVCEEQLSDLRRRLETLQAEAQHAQAHVNAETVRRTYGFVVDAKRALETAEKDLSATELVGEVLIKRVQDYETSINHSEIKLRAQKLAATIAAQRSVAISVERGTSGPEMISLAAGETWQDLDIAGKLTVTADDVTIVVASAQDNIEELVHTQQQAKQELHELLRSKGVETSGDLLAKRRIYQEKQRVRDDATAAYDQYLDGKTLEEWEHHIAELNSIPAARNQSTIADEMNDVRFQITAKERTQTESKELIDERTAEYGTTENLIRRIATDSAEKEKTQTSLDQLPPVPAGFESSEGFLHELERQSNALQEAERLLAEVMGQLRSMPASPSELSVNELQDEVLAKQEVFQRALAHGESLQRIRTTVQRVAARRDTAGPMQQLPTVVSEYFQQLTNGAYSEITMVERVPTTASGSVLRDFDVKRLSQGTKTSLALATRLALAHAYLAGRSGVIMLDDPCVDMDPERRKAAMSLLDDIGTTHQVVLFTCN